MVVCCNLVVVILFSLTHSTRYTRYTHSFIHALLVSFICFSCVFVICHANPFLVPSFLYTSPIHTHSVPIICPPQPLPEKGILYATAAMDSTTIFHENVNVGADSSQSSLVVLLASMLALSDSNVKRVLTDNNKTKAVLVFAAFAGESYDNVGSRKFLFDLMNRSGATCNLNMEHEEYGRGCWNPFVFDLNYLKLSNDLHHNRNFVFEIGSVGANYGNQLYVHYLNHSLIQNDLNGKNGKNKESGKSENKKESNFKSTLQRKEATQTSKSGKFKTSSTNKTTEKTKTTQTNTKTSHTTQVLNVLMRSCLCPYSFSIVSHHFILSSCLSSHPILSMLLLFIIHTAHTTHLSISFVVVSCCIVLCVCSFELIECVVSFICCLLVSVCSVCYCIVSILLCPSCLA